MSDLRALALVVISALSLLAPQCAQAEFYRWTDARGQVRISNIPPQGVNSDGRVAPAYNPSSIQTQQRVLRARLKARDQALQEIPAAHQSADEVEVDGSRSK
jgi:hypothetical protein